MYYFADHLTTIEQNYVKFKITLQYKMIHVCVSFEPIGSQLNKSYKMHFWDLLSNQYTDLLHVWT
jgi:hypothetical protein